jgi:putative heme iron utilization protein
MVMRDENVQLLHALVTGQRLLTLAVLVDAAPHASVLPYVLRPDGSAAIIQASRLSAHTKGLTDGAPFSVAIHEADRPDADPLQTARVTLDGHVSVIARDTPAFTEAEALLVQRFPAAAMTLSLGDFGLYELRFERGRLVGGFARASNVTAQTLAALAELMR